MDLLSEVRMPVFDLTIPIYHGIESFPGEPRGKASQPSTPSVLFLDNLPDGPKSLPQTEECSN